MSIFAVQKQIITKNVKIMEKNVKKCLLIGVITLVFWMISLTIMSIVNDRSRLSEETQTEIAETWSGKQEFIGPLLCVPVYDDAVNFSKPYTCMYVLPERIEINSDIESETLHRGIFDASVYRTSVSGKGVFNLKEMSATGNVAGNKNIVRYDWSNVQIITSIGDKRGIEDSPKFLIGDKSFELNQHFNNYGNSSLRPVTGYYKDAVCGIVDLTSMVGQEEVSFELSAELKGSEELDIAPIGKNTAISMRGNCKDPSFNGFLLPSSREVTENGFSATWKISSLNRNDVDQVLYSADLNYEFQTVGTRLLIKGGQYTQTDRALKYAFLVILLSLAAVFVSEMCVKSEINVLSYLLIGAALVLFYLMLLSFSEWIGFSSSYFLSALLILGMITLYLKAILKKNNIAMAACSFMALVDVFIYVLLSIASMALLVGTLGLFVILGVAMFFSLRLIKRTEQTVS